MRGRKPTPTLLKLAAGNPGRRPLNATEPVPPPGPLVKPDWLDGYASEMWDWIVPHLEGARIVRPADTTLVTQYCVTYSQWRTAAEWVRDHGLTNPDNEGRDWPQTKVFRQLGLLLVKLASELGITPAARPRLSVAENGAIEGTRSADEIRRRFFAAGA